MKKVILWLDDNLEPILIYVAYAMMAGLVFEQVVLRFLFKTQVAWSAGVAIYMFIWVTWLGAAYNVRKRSHLTFGEIRSQMPYVMQFFCLLIDAVLWVSLSVVVIYYALGQIELLQMNFAFVPGTSNLMQWWFYLIMPLGWGLIILRALQNLWQDIATFRRREPFQLNSQAIAE
ncbi:TRAP transporter small permease [Hwanghaeella sp. 1Z406]|jgi:TRAP-type C4-dicarboxylate transport system permease small subunit|uniref:TRAP transporter small permease n=1 Tax=Hwanghaeella sp. 1Z406 TaxID=3402811 RepID=UPI003B671330